ncbi:MAG: helicase [Desulfobacteraceae bacterium]|nr:MAG: helicase [Desulfobacteraceae bacterium]
MIRSSPAAISISPNPELQIAHDLVQYTDRNVFLTGKAGTGKTTFLHSLRGNTHKRMIVTAPTGVAAINAGGVTLHSFFQMPFGPFVPGSEAYNRGNRYRFSKDKINIIRTLDLLVIDEISMVRADLLDGVDAALRRYRRNELPFGGVQLLMIGDLHQLSPVAKEADWSILREFYESVYFFGSSALRQTDLVSIELKHIYRQSDESFIELLNRVRDNRLDPDTLKELNSRFIPHFTPDDNEGYITLSTHNSGADAINKARLEALRQKEHHFDARIEGDFPEYSYPTSPALELKKGAQVMFVRNDPSREKLYFNGKIGKVTKISDRTVFVKCPDDESEIAVEPAVWENIKYRIDPATREITEEKVGEFVQIPLKLAWAITIHKSQGLTFDRAIIDARAAFAHGQVYVALSRCKSLAGIVLSSPISPHVVKADETVSSFIARASENPLSREDLEIAKARYQHRLLTECFDFQRLRGSLSRMTRFLLGNARTVKVSGVEDLRDLEKKAEEEIFRVGEKFKGQLRRLFADNNLPESDASILERTMKASVYFEEKIDKGLGDCLRRLRIETDNKEMDKRAREALDELKKEAAVKMAGVKSCRNGFSPVSYLRALSSAEIDFNPAKVRKAISVEYTASDVGHPELFQALKEWRAEKAAGAEVPPYRILHQRVLIQISVLLPDNLNALKKIKGFGERTAEKHGKELLALVSSYRQKHKIQEVTPPPPKAAEDAAVKGGRPSANETRQASLELFKKGLTIEQVAKERGLARSTVEGHLSFFVEAGEIEIGRLLPEEKLQAVERMLLEMKDRSLGEIKRALGDDYSYGEIKMVRAHRAHLEKKA